MCVLAIWAGLRCSNTCSSELVLLILDSWEASDKLGR
jgi:hypothetical protein